MSLFYSTNGVNNTKSEVREKVLELYRKHNMRLVLKTNSYFMKVIGVLIWVFNPRFKEYTTTVGSTVYFPDQIRVNNTDYLAKISGHEARHVFQLRELQEKYTKPVGSMLFSLKYSFPENLAVLSLFAVLAIWFSNFWILALAFIIPLLITPFIPSPFRADYEVEGYTNNVLYWCYYNNRKPSEYSYDWIVDQFSGANYLFMWPNDRIAVEYAVRSLAEELLEDDDKLEKFNPFLFELRPYIIESSPYYK